MDVSIILTFHSEELAAYKTLLCIENAAKKLAEANVSYEIIAHIDNGDETTIRCVESFAKDHEVRIFRNSFGEPSASRNFSVKEAKGRYVALIDGDDLITDNFLIDGYNMLEKASEDYVLHCEYNLTFGIDECSRLWHMYDSMDDDTDLLISVGRNRWSSGTFLKRSVAKKFPYELAANGYGYEDWHFNLETLAAGIKHKVIPHSILFYRIKQSSIYKSHLTEDVAVRYTSYFETGRIKELIKRLESKEKPEVKPARKRPQIYDVLRKGHAFVRRMPGLRRFDAKLTSVATRIVSKHTIEKSLPPFFIEEWKKMNKIDNSLYPHPEIVSRLPLYVSEQDYLGYAYCKLIKDLERDPDYLILPPILGVGGTEKVIVNYLRAIKKIHPDWHVAVFGKLPEGHPFEVPDNVSFIDFDKITENLPDWDKSFLLTKFIVQTKVKRLHIINNTFYYHWALKHMTLLKKNDFKLNVSYFMKEYCEDNEQIAGFSDPWISTIYPCVNKIFTDNAHVVEELCENNCYDKKRICVHYQPAELKFEKPHKIKDGEKIRILWASRIAPQKRPDLIKKIASKLDSSRFQIDVYGTVHPDLKSADLFGGVSGLSYKGSYSGLDSIKTEDYDIFLYTSQTDGLPNVLLEVTAKGLPIVASEAGGIGDIVKNKETGRTVAIEDIDGYATAIEELADRPELTHKYAEEAQKLVKERHSFEKFLKTVEADFD